MESILTDVNWVTVLVGALVSFVVGSFWYGDFLFGRKWRQGLGTAAVQGRTMPLLLFVEAVSCLLLAWLMVVTADISIWLAVLAAVAMSVAIKANGMFSGKTIYAIAVESSYILIKAVVVIITYQIFK
jgi:hypothetical protein